jgi:endonuclease YncB( thermonuclease family)
VVDIWPKDPKSTSVRIIGYDAAEMRPKKKGRTEMSRQCEIGLAKKARAVAVRLLTSANEITLTQIDDDAYPGRVAAVVLIDGVDIAKPMLASGLVREFHKGDKRQPWCQ